MASYSEGGIRYRWLLMKHVVTGQSASMKGCRPTPKKKAGSQSNHELHKRIVLRLGSGSFSLFVRGKFGCWRNIRKSRSRELWILVVGRWSLKGTLSSVNHFPHKIRRMLIPRYPKTFTLIFKRFLWYSLIHSFNLSLAGNITNREAEVDHEFQRPLCTTECISSSLWCLFTSDVALPGKKETLKAIRAAMHSKQCLLLYP